MQTCRLSYGNRGHPLPPPLCPNNLSAQNNHPWAEVSVTEIKCVSVPTDSPNVRPPFLRPVSTPSDCRDSDKSHYVD